MQKHIESAQLTKRHVDEFIIFICSFCQKLINIVKTIINAAEFMFLDEMPAELKENRTSAIKKETFHNALD